MNENNLDENNFISYEYKKLSDNIEKMENLSVLEINNSIYSHRKIIGPALIVIKKCLRKIINIFLGWYISPILESQNKFNLKVVETLKLLKCASENQIYICKQELVEKELKIDKLNNLLNCQNERAEHRDNALKCLAENIESVNIQSKDRYNETIDRISGVIGRYDNALKCLTENIESVNIQSKDRYNETSNIINRIIGQYDNSLKCLAENIESVNIQSKNRYDMNYEYIKAINKNIEYVFKRLNVKCDLKFLTQKVDYFDFENRFRGDRISIINKQRQYTKYFNLGKGEVLDIGCGRGEFLELMISENISAYGVDVYEPFVDYCIGRGFRAIKVDALTHLNSLLDSSLGGIFMDSVIEHIEDDYLLSLIDMAYKKLKVGCYFIIISPNPETFGGMAYFNLDLEHKKPLHYLTLEYFLKRAGFMKVERYESPEAEFPFKVEHINGLDFENKKAFNDGMDAVNKYLFGNKEYVIIAQK